MEFSYNQATSAIVKLTQKEMVALAATMQVCWESGLAAGPVQLHQSDSDYLNVTIDDTEIWFDLALVPASGAEVQRYIPETIVVSKLLVRVAVYRCEVTGQGPFDFKLVKT